MQYGFVIDNRKCIGCHACTTACKSEHDVPVGVNRTWVKYIEKGEFPDTRRMFSVMRCNHCSDAPCVTICPTEALFTRADGIVDFDKERCIGCKSCMQACPYDALYIDPDTNTAAKCNYCAHRIDLGLEPACVNVCPEQAIISGDIEDPSSEIANLLARQSVTVRKPEKDTLPNVYYIEGDQASLTPTATATSDINLWGSQTRGVGHFAKAADEFAFTNDDVIKELLKQDREKTGTTKESEKRVYDTPDKGRLWGWEVWSYVWTKAISAGIIMVSICLSFFSSFEWNTKSLMLILASSLVFLSVTGILLIKDLDQPKRFLYVLLRPHWTSWLVKGGYAISIFGALLLFTGVTYMFAPVLVFQISLGLTGLIALIVASYTAFLFAQAKGRDFWQSPVLAIHMLNHSFMAGTSALLIFSLFNDNLAQHSSNLLQWLAWSIIFNLLITVIEVYSPHPTADSRRTAHMITSGLYRRRFWIGCITFGHIIPVGLIVLGNPTTPFLILSAVLVLSGIYILEKIWVEAPQLIPLR